MIFRGFEKIVQLRIQFKIWRINSELKLSFFFLTEIYLSFFAPNIEYRNYFKIKIYRFKFRSKFCKLFTNNSPFCVVNICLIPFSITITFHGMMKCDSSLIGAVENDNSFKKYNQKIGMKQCVSIVTFYCFL